MLYILKCKNSAIQFLKKKKSVLRLVSPPAAPVLSLLVSADTTLIVRVFFNVLNVLKHVNDNLAKLKLHKKQNQ